MLNTRGNLTRHMQHKVLRHAALHLNEGVTLRGLSSETYSLETEYGFDIQQRCTYLLNRWVVLDTGGNNLSSPPPDGSMGVLQQAQQRRQTPNGVQICSSMCCPLASASAENFTCTHGQKNKQGLHTIDSLCQHTQQ